MASGRRRIAIAVATVALAAPLAVGCSAVDKALDCVHTADDVAESATDLQRAVEKAGDDPLAADEALDAIEKNLGEIGDKADDADVGKAVDHLQKAVGNVRDSIKSGDSTPDVSPVVDATGELTKACKP
ncbi:hypothetical protein DSC45_07050 [Streptomyces sp. YIM 130001]|uniref:hypothetical protein n=1 Tax=Streptomyces sp. YIM 130001 TaxID=2259644 RepID=UPI000E650CE0|nr:hypothetical protein [Streptomyces sp. YIM 130001]RII19751.1 hypothetical protein DSC45_07050 [Streptomyces sp. YIM 130001]